jgi:hypothetical protein
VEPLSQAFKVITGTAAGFRAAGAANGYFATLGAVKRIHVAAAAALVVLVVPALTGCFNGLEATTTTQASMNTGNGVEAIKGPIHIENATLVMGPEGSSTATLVTRLVNTGVEDDALTYATINGVPATIIPPAELGDSGNVLAPGASVSYGYETDARINAEGFDVPVSNYVDVELGFEKAGLVSMSILTVPPVGYYAGITP